MCSVNSNQTDKHGSKHYLRQPLADVNIVECSVLLMLIILIITFRVRRIRREMYSSYGRLCVCLCVCLSLAAFQDYCTDPNVAWENGKGCPLVVHCWADLQSVHAFRCYENIVLNAKCQRVLVVALCLVTIAITVPVCGSVCRIAYIKNHTSKLREIFCTCYVLPWFGPLMTTIQYIMYFRCCVVT